jgi:hypothetical protein
MQYHFKKFESGKDPVSIIFAKPDCIFELNLETEVIEIILNFTTPLLIQPNFFQMNSDQSICVIASDSDGLYINLNKDEQIDLD